MEDIKEIKNEKLDIVTGGSAYLQEFTDLKIGDWIAKKAENGKPILYKIEKIRTKDPKTNFARVFLSKYERRGERRIDRSDVWDYYPCDCINNNPVVLDPNRFMKADSYIVNKLNEAEIVTMNIKIDI